MSPSLLDPRIRTEKLLAPRALIDLGGALYGPPLPPSRRAWLAWLDLPAHNPGTLDVIARVIQRARADGATRLCVGGPPGNYVHAGVDAADTVARALYEAHGFTVQGTSCDLVVTVPSLRAVPGESTQAVLRCTDADADTVLDWIARVFTPNWAIEAARAQGHRGLFVARSDEGALTGFVAHSGNNVAWGTFGPVGVVPEARGGGLGRALTRTALDDLHARGFSRVTVPWVAPATVPFYARLATVEHRIDRLHLAQELSPVT